MTTNKSPLYTVMINILLLIQITTQSIMTPVKVTPTLTLFCHTMLFGVTNQPDNYSGYLNPPLGKEGFSFVVPQITCHWKPNHYLSSRTSFKFWNWNEKAQPTCHYVHASLQWQELTLRAVKNDTLSLRLCSFINYLVMYFMFYNVQRAFNVTN